MNNFEIMKSVKVNTQIENVLIGFDSIEIFIYGESESLKFDKSSYYEFLRADGFVYNYEGKNEDSQLAEYENHDYRFNSFDSVYHFILEEVESIERHNRLKTAQLPDLSFATTQLKNLL